MMECDGWDSDQETVIFDPKQVQHSPPHYKHGFPPAPNIPTTRLQHQTQYPPAPTSSHYYNYPPPGMPTPYYNPHPNTSMSQPQFVHPSSHSVPKSHKSSRHHRRSHTHRHKGYIRFPKTNTRYSKMKLNVGSLDLSGKGFLNMLHLNRTRCLWSCWEREIIPRVPSKTPAADPLPTSQCQMEPESPVEYKDTFEAMLEELQNDVEMFFPDEDEDKVESAGVCKPSISLPSSPQPVISTPPSPQVISEPFPPPPPVISKPPPPLLPNTKLKQASSIFMPPPATSRPQEASHITNPSQATTDPPKPANHTLTDQESNPATNTSGQQQEQSFTTEVSASSLLAFLKSHTAAALSNSPGTTAASSVDSPGKGSSNATHDETVVHKLMRLLQEEVEREGRERKVSEEEKRKTCPDDNERIETRCEINSKDKNRRGKVDEVDIMKERKGEMEKSSHRKHRNDRREEIERTSNNKEDMSRKRRREEDKREENTEVELNKKKTWKQEEKAEERDRWRDSKRKKTEYEGMRKKTHKQKSRSPSSKWRRSTRSPSSSSSSTSSTSTVDSHTQRNKTNRSSKTTRTAKDTPSKTHAHTTSVNSPCITPRDTQSAGKATGAVPQQHTPLEAQKEALHSVWEVKTLEKPKKNRWDQGETREKMDSTVPETTERAKKNRWDQGDTRKRDSSPPETAEKPKRNRWDQGDTRKRDSSPPETIEKAKRNRWDQGDAKKIDSTTPEMTEKPKRNRWDQRESVCAETSSVKQSTNRKLSWEDKETPSSKLCSQRYGDSRMPVQEDVSNIIPKPFRVTGKATPHKATPAPPSPQEDKRSIPVSKSSKKLENSSSTPQKPGQTPTRRQSQEDSSKSSSLTPQQCRRPSQEDTSNINVPKSSKNSGHSSSTPQKPEQAQSRRPSQEDRSSASVVKSESSISTPQNKRLSQEDTKINTSVNKSSKRHKDSFFLPQKSGKTERRSSQEDTSKNCTTQKSAQMQSRRPSQENAMNTSVAKHDNSSFTPQKSGQMQSRRPSQEDKSKIAFPKTSQKLENFSSTPQTPGKTESRRPSQEDKSNASFPKSSKKPENSNLMPQKPPQRSKGDTLPGAPQNCTSTPGPESSKGPKTPQPHSNHQTASQPLVPEPHVTPPSPCMPHDLEGVVVKKEPLFLLSDMEIKQEPLSPSSAMYQREEDLARQVKTVKEEPVSSEMASTAHTDRHLTAVEIKPINQARDISGYEEIVKSETFLEDEEQNYEEEEKTNVLLQEEEKAAVDRNKVRSLTKTTLEVLGIEEGMDSDKWDSQVPRTLYEHLKNVLQRMECSVWEESMWLSYNWEVNLRRLVVATFCREELDTFTRDIHKHMQKTGDLKVFIRSVINSNSIP